MSNGSVNAKKALRLEIAGLLEDIEGLGPVSAAFHLRALREVGQARTVDLMLASALLARSNGKSRKMSAANRIGASSEPTKDASSAGCGSGFEHEEINTECSVAIENEQRERFRLYEQFFRNQIASSDERYSDGASEAGIILDAAIKMAITRIGGPLVRAALSEVALTLSAERYLPN